MASLETRIAKLEATAPADSLLRLAVAALPPLDECGELAWNDADPWHREYRSRLAEVGDRANFRLADPVDRGLADLMLDPCFVHQPLSLERYRDRLPARVLRAVYNSMRNYGFPPVIRTRVRQLAGVLDDSGKLLAGYELTDNGLINDASSAPLRIAIAQGSA